ncbi:MAG: peptide ABC transporter substrate-binding protein [Trueperaceae bacterium]|nr:peptide ABC transporter substrate-binding protein [Trueperaceae bacterium]
MRILSISMMLIPLLLGTGMAQKTLNVSLSQDPYIIDPTANWLYDVPANMFVTLVGYDFETSTVSPAGADSWSVSDDGTTYTFHIREGWNWSDGKPVTAEDYAFAFERIVDPATAAPMAYRLYIIEGAQALNQGETTDMSTLGVKVIDSQTLEIKLVSPASWFLSSLGSIGHAIPKWTLETHGDDWTLPENVVVNGPYTLTQIEAEDLAVLEKNPSYFAADSVDIDTINLYVVKEESTALALFEDGDLDIVSVPATDLDRVKNDPMLSAEFYNGPKNIIYYYDFNVLQPPFDNVKVRQAFVAAVDKQSIVDFITKGGEVVAPTLTPPGSVGHVPASAGIGIPFDPEHAKALLAEAGYPGGEGLPPITLAFNSSETHSRIAQAVQQMWQQTLGASVELQPVEGRAYSQIAAEGAFNVWRMGWGMDYPDANNIHGELFTSEVGAPAIVRNAQYDSLVAEAAVEQDPARRLEMYTEAEKILVQDEAGVMPIYWSAENLLIKPYLKPVLSGSFNREFWKWTLEN